MQMTYDSMMMFAETWIAAWNRRDVQAILAHFAEEAKFVSPMTRKFGRPPIGNKQELESYWRAALDHISILEFKLDHAMWDERRRELNVIYEANLNGERKRACEIMQFDASGQQIRGEALYGVRRARHQQVAIERRGRARECRRVGSFKGVADRPLVRAQSGHGAERGSRQDHIDGCRAVKWS